MSGSHILEATTEQYGKQIEELRTRLAAAEKERDALKVGIMLLFEWDEDTPYYITENNITQAIPKRIERRIKRLIGYSNNSPIKREHQRRYKNGASN